MSITIKNLNIKVFINNSQPEKKESKEQQEFLSDKMIVNMVEQINKSKNER